MAITLEERLEITNDRIYGIHDRLNELRHQSKELSKQIPRLLPEILRVIKNLAQLIDELQAQGTAYPIKEELINKIAQDYEDLRDILKLVLYGPAALSKPFANKRELLPKFTSLFTPEHLKSDPTIQGKQKAEIYAQFDELEHKLQSLYKLHNIEAKSTQFTAQEYRMLRLMHAAKALAANIGTLQLKLQEHLETNYDPEFAKEFMDQNTQQFKDYCMGKFLDPDVQYSIKKGMLIYQNNFDDLKGQLNKFLELVTQDFMREFRREAKSITLESGDGSSSSSRSRSRSNTRSSGS